MKRLQTQVLALSLLILLGLSANSFSQEGYSSARDEWEVFNEVAQLEMQGDLEAAIEMLKADIANKQRSPSLVLEERRYLAQIYLDNDRPKDAIEVFTDLLSQPLHPLDEYDFLNDRADSYDQIGKHELAKADRLSAKKLIVSNTDLDFEYAPSSPSQLLRETIENRLRQHFPELSSTKSGKVAILFFWGALVWLLIVIWDIWKGNRQRIEGEGTWKRLVGVSAVMALFQSLPFQIFLLYFMLLPEETELDTPFDVAVVTTILSTFWVSLYFVPAIRWIGSKEPLTKVDDEQFLLRLNRMSTELGIRPPVARLLPSSGGPMMIQAFAGGLPQPSLTLSDGVLMRLEEHEVDAIVGHELGHIANKSLWCFPISAALAWACPILVSTQFEFWTSLMFGMAVFAGLSRIVSRYFEYDSDRKAAQVAGVSATITALDKTHIASAVNNQGWASFLAYSMATHPSQEERLSALAMNAPADDQPKITWSPRTAIKRRWGARIAFLCWVGILITCFFVPETDNWQMVRGLVLATIFFLPQLMIQKAIRKEVRSEMKRRQVRQKSILSLIAVIAAVLLFILISWSLSQDVENIVQDDTGFSSYMFWISVVVLTVLFIIWNQRKAARSPVAQIRLAFHQKRWADAVELGRVNWENLKPNAAVRNDLILALWMTGEEERAIQAMRQLQKDFPKFKHPWVMEALMHLDRGEFQTALDVLDEVKRDLKDDLGRLGIVARASRFLGKIDDVRETADQMESISPDLAAIHSFRSLVAMDTGDSETALEQIQKAEYLAPGDAYINLLKAEYEFRFGDRNAGLKTLAAAKVLVNATPFAFLRAELKHVEKLAQPEIDSKEPNSGAEVEAETVNDTDPETEKNDA